MGGLPAPAPEAPHSELRTRREGAEPESRDHQFESLHASLARASEACVASLLELVRAICADNGVTQNEVTH